ncbi:MAG: hypothetical protein LWX11_06075 [Firmicutes bacterium]|nr:hypothetical protein [Bacillota bacterium]
MLKSYYAGMEIDAPCGRCKGETRHRILSITNGTPEKLICATCNSIHKFRPERPAPSPAAPRAPKMATAATPRPASSATRFQELMIAEQAGSRALPYSPSHSWTEGAWMDHPSFGLGKVQRKAGRKAEVLFRDGLKTLISA